MKKCPFCGTELPEEASFCLNCSSVLNEKPAVTKQKKKPIIVIPTKKIAQIASIVCAAAIVLASCFFAIKSVRKIPASQDTPSTSLVPVTEENGEIATNEDGAQIFEIIEVTEPDTKKNFFEAIIDKVTGNDDTQATEPVTEQDDQNSETASNLSSENGETPSSTELRTTIIYNPTETTTDKSSFWENIFDWDNIRFPEPEGTTKAKETTTSSIKPSKPAPVDPTKPATTEAVTKPTTTEAVTKPVTTEPATKPVTTEPVTTAPTQPSTSDFEYVEVDGEIKITKYKGNSSTVTVPAYINGKHVAFLGENAFANNSNIQKIVFTGITSGTSRFYLPKSRTVFNNLPNLTSITFPYETYQRMTDDAKKAGNNTFYQLITNCPKLSAVHFSEKLSPDFSSTWTLTMYSVDGVVFARQNTNTSNGQKLDSYLLYYPPAKSNSSYTVPSRVIQIEKFAFSNNPYIKSIHFTATTSYVTWNFLGCTSLSSFTVDSGNAKLFAKDGVLYTGSATVNGVAYKSFFYPPAKTDANFTFIDGYNLAMDGYSFCGNPYLKTVKFCQGALIYRDLQDGAGMPVALTSISLNSAYTNKVDTDKKAPFTITYY
ncbi:MAG: leucine-rich repeat protein [Clostridia bacterium]|nr:leucine-rich repeat protein [Clostridia bacterium]